MVRITFRYSAVLLTFGALVVLILYSAETLPFSETAWEAVLFRLFPALFPNLFCAALLTELCLCGRARHSARRVVLISVFLALACGHQSAHFAVFQAHKRGIISKKCARKLANCLFVPPPALCISYLGKAILSSAVSGLAVYLGACLGAGVLLLIRFPYFKNRLSDPPDSDDFSAKTDLSDSFFKSLYSACGAFLALGGAYFLFSILLTPAARYFEPRVFSLIYALCEPVGAAGLLQSAFGKNALYLCAFSLTFGGVSGVIFSSKQSLTLFTSRRKYLFARLRFAALTVFLMSILTKIFRIF